MNDKKALLDELTLRENDRTLNIGKTRLLITVAGAVLLAVAAWFLFAPDNPPVQVETAVARAADGAADAGAGGAVPVLDATGYVTARRQTTVSSKLTGRVLEVLVEEGDLVEEGQLLAQLDDSTERASYELAQAQFEATEARLSELEVQRQEAQFDLERTEELKRKNFASDADLDRVRLAVAGLDARIVGLKKDVEVARKTIKIQRQQLDDMQIRAPFAGVIIDKAAQPGEIVSPSSGGGGFTRTGICTIVDMESLEVEVDVNESYINRVTSGQPAVAVLNSYPDWQIPVEVITIIPTADRSKATVRVRIGFLLRDSRILPDMGVKVSFLENVSAQVEPTAFSGVFVPASAVAFVDNRNIVFVVDANTAVPRAVKLGVKRGAERNIIAGVKPGDVIVTQLDENLIARLKNGRAQITYL